jgi:two-component system NtrC family response regulator
VVIRILGPAVVSSLTATVDFWDFTGVRGVAVAAIDSHQWPGNVRELENCIRRAVIMADGNQITAADVGLAAGSDDDLAFLNLRAVRDEAEKRAVITVLARVNGNIVKAAEVLGVSRPTLYDIMHKFGLK